MKDEIEASAPKPSWLGAAALFVGFFVVVCAPLLLLEQDPKWDARDEFYPAYSYFADSIGEGRWPLWDPFTNCGHPFFAEPHEPTINPIALLLALCVPNHALGFLLLYTIHWCLAGIGMILLIRHLGGNPAGALVAAFAFAFSGYFFGHAEHTPFIIHASWVPWIFVLGDRYIETERWEFLLLGAGVFGVSTLGGYPPLIAFTALALPIWLCARFPRKWKRILIACVVIGVVSFLVWLPVLRAFATEGLTHTERTAAVDPHRANFSDPFPVPAILTLYFPFFTFSGLEWMNADLSMVDGYVGFLTLPLALYWFRYASLVRRPWWLAGFCGFAFWISLGGWFGLRTVVYYLYFPLRYVQYNSIFRLYWMFGLAVAAGLGWATVSSSPEHWGRFRSKLTAYLLIPTAVALVTMHALLIFKGDATPRLDLYLPALVVLPLAVLVFRTARPARAAAIIAPGVLLILLDAGLHAVVQHDLWLEDGGALRSWEATHVAGNAVNGSPKPRLAARTHGFFNVQQIDKRSVVLGYQAIRSKEFDDVLASSAFSRVLQDSQRFWLCSMTRSAAGPAVDRGRALNTLKNSSSLAAAPLFVQHLGTDGQPGPIQDASAGERSASGAVSVRRFAPETVVLDVHNASGAPAFLSSTERWARSWQVSVDGRPAESVLTNLFFRGAVIPPGRHVVEWRYRPAYWNSGVVLSGVLLTLCVGGGLVLLVRGTIVRELQAAYAARGRQRVD